MAAASARCCRPSSGLDYDAIFSADGKWIVFTSERDGAGDGQADLWRVHPDGTGLERLTRDPVDGRRRRAVARRPKPGLCFHAGRRAHGQHLGDGPRDAQGAQPHRRWQQGSARHHEWPFPAGLVAGWPVDRLQLGSWREAGSAPKAARARAIRTPPACTSCAPMAADLRRIDDNDAGTAYRCAEMVCRRHASSSPMQLPTRDTFAARMDGVRASPR